MSCPHGEYVQGELRQYQGRSREDRDEGTPTSARRPRAVQVAATGTAPKM